MPVDFEPTPLENGEVQGFFSFITNEPNILRVKGLDVGTLNLSDVGITLYQQLYTVTEESLETNRDQLVAALRAESKGWQHAIADNQLAIDLTLERLRGRPRPRRRVAGARDHVADRAAEVGGDRRRTASSTWATTDLENNLRVLSDLGLPVSEDLYTNEILDEVYADGITLYTA